MGVNGGYNILMAYNTLYRIGERSHILECAFGSRSCDGQPGDPGRDSCSCYLDAGGWGTTVIDDGSNNVRIPNKNIYIYNNILYNPTGYQSRWMHFAIFGPESGSTQSGANVPIPTLADENLQIRGNIISNGPPDHSLGIDGDSGGQPDNPTCNEAQLRAENTINTIEPQLVEPGNGNFRPVEGGNVFNVQTYSIPAFTGNDRPQPPISPEGNLNNDLSHDYDSNDHVSSRPPGAFISSTSPVVKRLSTHMPEFFSLLQNYPNPFNPITTIEFYLPHPTKVMLSIFNHTGREVDALVNEWHNAGHYSVEWNILSGNISSGLYLYKIIAGEYSAIKKCLVLK